MMLPTNTLPFVSNMVSPETGDRQAREAYRAGTLKGHTL